MTHKSELIFCCWRSPPWQAQRARIPGRVIQVKSKLYFSLNKAFYVTIIIHRGSSLFQVPGMILQIYLSLYSYYYYSTIFKAGLIYRNNGMFITLVPKVLQLRFLIRWLNNFGSFYWILIGWFVKLGVH